MDSLKVTHIIQQALPDAEVIVEGADCSFKVVVISDEFHGLWEVKRQLNVLNLFSNQLRTGELHSLTVKAYTANEWSSVEQSQLTQLVL